tara:strand:+ start:2109 stop:2285 length:177 start_codon:yes stop_codon:yes gene_type:complete
MTKFFLFLLAVVFTLIGVRLITYKTKNHDADMVLKIIGWIILPIAAWIVLESLKLINI